MMGLLIAQAGQAGHVAAEAITWPEAFMKVGCSFAIALSVWALFKRS